GGLAVGHIRADGTIETHAATEERLLAISGADLFRDRAQNLAHAYRRRARAIAARLKELNVTGARMAPDLIWGRRAQRPHDRCRVRPSIQSPHAMSLIPEGAQDSGSDAARMRTIEPPSASRTIVVRVAALALAALLAPSGAIAQDKGTLNPQPLPPLAKPDDPATPAKELFGRKTAPAPLQARTIGFYSKGCLAGAVALPINGPTWQVMRLSRNRNWGHPKLIEFLEHLSAQAPKTGWHGLLV